MTESWRRVSAASEGGAVRENVTKLENKGVTQVTPSVPHRGRGGDTIKAFVCLTCTGTQRANSAESLVSVGGPLRSDKLCRMASARPANTEHLCVLQSYCNTAQSCCPERRCSGGGYSPCHTCLQLSSPRSQFWRLFLSWSSSPSSSSSSSSSSGEKSVGAVARDE